MPNKDVSTPRVFICRHGETEWSITGQHTGSTNIPLTANGVAQVRATSKLVFGPGKLIDTTKLSDVFVSPRLRAQQTAGHLLTSLRPSGSDVRTGSVPDSTTRPDESEMYRVKGITHSIAELAEWDYGEYEGLTPAQIRKRREDKGLDRERKWDIWRDGCEGGETPEQVTKRVDELIGRIREPHRRWLAGQGADIQGGPDVLLIAHGHILRAFAKRWLGYPLEFPLSMVLEPGGVGVLSYQHHNVDEPAFLLGVAFPQPADAESS